MLETKRLYFSHWKDCDQTLTYQLWSNPQVTQYIGIKEEDIIPRYQKEIQNDETYHVSYWPIFLKETNELIGCCGLRPYQDNIYELGFHFLPQYWHQGYAFEAAQTVIHHAFSTLKVNQLVAGHHPMNHASAHLLMKLGFIYRGDEYYQPTGLYHPSYQLTHDNS